MAADDHEIICGFGTLFTKNVPHIMEKIFFSLDYDSLKTCPEVCTAWKGLLTSESYLEKAKSIYRGEIARDEYKLWTAAQEGKVKEVRSLSGNIFVNVNWGRCTTPLFEAAKMAAKIPRPTSRLASYISVIKLLLDRGADPNLANSYGLTPLHVAASHGNKDVVQLLLDRGANIDLETPSSSSSFSIRTDSGMTALHWAAKFGKRDVVHLLLDKAAKPNSKDKQGSTPLHEAASQGHKDVVQLLLNAGADPNKANNSGRTPLDLTKKDRHMGTVAILKNALKKQ